MRTRWISCILFLVVIVSACGKDETGSTDKTAPVTSANPAGGTYADAVAVTLICSDSGSGCHATFYTLDGSAPTTGSSVYSQPISISVDHVLKFFSVDKDDNQEAVRSETYTITGAADTTAPTTTAAPTGGTFNVTQNVTLTCNDGGGSGCAATYFTTDGSEPTTTATVYAAAIAIPDDLTLKFFSVDNAGNAEAVKTQAYVIDPAFNDTIAPITTATPAAGTYESGQTITLVCDDGAGSGCATTYYTTSGADPTTSSPVYSTPIALNRDMTIKFFSVDHSANAETPKSAAYVLLCTNPADTDGDGVTDCVELLGWDVYLDLNGDGDTLDGGELIHVTSDPALDDTDSDGLDDSDEYQLRSNPRLADTDGDGLDDVVERDVYGSNPNDVDSDDDALNAMGTPNPLFFDGNEVDLFGTYGTSPSLADTDGDSYTDREEYLAATNPLVANVPRLELEWLGGLTVQVNGVLQGGCTTGTETFSSTLDKNEATSQQSSATADKHTFNASASISATVGGQTFPPMMSGSATVSGSVSTGTVQERKVSFTASSMTASQQEYGRKASTSCFNESTVTGGSVTGMVRITNVGEVSVSVSNMAISLLRLDPNQTNGFATLGGATVFTTQADLGNGSHADAAVTVSVTSPTLAKQLAANPAGLAFSVGTYTLTDEDLRSFVYLQEHVITSTALVELDFGGGRVERHFVATNVDRELGGVRLGVALADYVGLPTQTALTDSGFTTFSSLDGVGYNQSALQFWYILGNGTQYATAAADVDQLLLQAGDYVGLVLLKDPDHDGLYDREELSWGSNPNATDSDLDTVNDLAEVQTNRRHPAIPEFPGNHVVQVATAPNSDSTSTMVLLSNGTIWTWGRNSTGNLGLGAAAVGQDFETPQRMGTDADWAYIATGGSVTCSLAVKTNGTLWAWGSNFYGCLGTGGAPTGNQPSPVQVGVANTWRKVSVGSYHVLATGRGTRIESDLYAWGRDDYGQVGSGAAANQPCPGLPSSVTCQNSPVLIDDAAAGTAMLPMQGWVQVAAGGQHSLALLQSLFSSTAYSLFSWGRNSVGQLGQGNTTDLDVPTQVGTSSYTMVSAGYQESSAVGRITGPTLYSLMTWGRGDLGSLGMIPQNTCGTTACTMAPYPAALPLLWGPQLFGAIQAGQAGFAIREDDTGYARLYSMGLNNQLQLGVAATDTCGTYACNQTPEEVPSLSTTEWTRVAYSRAINAAGEVWAWGRNQYGQLGCGNFTDSATPVKVPEYPLP